MADIGIRLGMVAALLAVSLYQHAVVFPADSNSLQQDPRPSPFHLRWLIPMIAGERVWLWATISWCSLGTAVVLWPGGHWSAALFCCLPWARLMAVCPVLTDAPALLSSLVAGALRGRTAALVGLLSAGISERAPVWGALYGWHLWPLAGLVAVAAIAIWMPKAERQEPPALMVGWIGAMRWSMARRLLLPWGAGLAALLSSGWTLQDAAIVAVAYGQMLVAHDTTRMYQWAAPVVTTRAMAVIPERWRLAAVVATWFSPWSASQERQSVLV